MGDSAPRGGRSLPRSTTGVPWGRERRVGETAIVGGLNVWWGETAIGEGLSVWWG